MIKNIALATLAGLAICMSSSSMAASYGVPADAPAPILVPTTDQWYVTGAGGATYTRGVNTPLGELHYEIGYDITGALGYKIDSGRFEAQYIYQHSPHKELITVERGGRTRVHSAMGNLYYDFDYDEVIPYLVAGAGWGNIEASGDIASSPTDDNEFAYQAGGGFNIDLGNNMMGFLEVKYFATTKARNQLNDNFRNVLLNLGISAYMDV